MTEKERIQNNKKSLRNKKKNARAVVETRWRNKMRLIQYKGGKCEVCGYCKPVAAAYHFHHKDPTKKDFGIGQHMSNSLEKLKIEVDKCELLCSNCHSETHDKQNAFSREQTIKSWAEWDIDEEARRKRKLPSNYICKNCKTSFRPSRRKQFYCSIECRIINKRKVVNRPSVAEIEEMLKTMSMCAIGRKYNVSDNAVRKWLK